MSDAAAPSKPNPKKRSLLPALLIVAAFGGGAAAGGAGAVMAFASMPGGGHEAAAAPDAKAPLDYVEIDNAFTTNLVDTGRFLQLRIAVSTTGGPPTVAALATHKLAIVSAVLGVLGDLSENDVAGATAKAKLRRRLRETIDNVLRQKAGAVGIDEVFLTSLVVQ